MAEVRPVLGDPEVLQALAHPVRLDVLQYRQLQVADPRPRSRQVDVAISGRRDRTASAGRGHDPPRDRRAQGPVGARVCRHLGHPDRRSPGAGGEGAVRLHRRLAAQRWAAGARRHRRALFRAHRPRHPGRASVSARWGESVLPRGDRRRDLRRRRRPPRLDQTRRLDRWEKARWSCDSCTTA
jgi:hypothetical protein